VEIPEKAKAEFEALMKGVACGEIGRVTKNPKLTISGLKATIKVEAPLADLRRSWKGTLSSGVSEA
jgi:hypothetical protein